MVNRTSNQQGTAQGQLPGVPSALNINNYRNPTTPSQQRLKTPNYIMGPATGWPRAVYMGDIEVEANRVPFKPGYKEKISQLVPIQDARYMWQTLAPAGRERLEKAATAYFGHNRWDESWLKDMWERAINVSANALAYGNQKITPVDAFEIVLSQARREEGRAGGGGGGRGGGGGVAGPTTTVQMTESVNLTDPGTATQVVNRTLQEYLGRDATETERENFISALNRRERQSPSRTQQRVTSTPGRGTSVVEQETFTEGGFNPSQFALEFSQAQEGAAEYRAATTLLDTFIGALKARV